VLVDALGSWGKPVRPGHKRLKRGSGGGEGEHFTTRHLSGCVCAVSNCVNVVNSECRKFVNVVNVVNSEVSHPVSNLIVHG
jgi:hypothetical protein